MGLEVPHIAILGNPNSGKSSLFNSFTGLNQKVGNFPGVTVEKKSGTSILKATKGFKILDLPGSYSLYPRREDEWVAYRALMEPNTQTPIDLLVVVVDASNLSRNLLYASQLIDLDKPIVIALTMVDLAEQMGHFVDAIKLSALLDIPVVPINPRTGSGVDRLDEVMASSLSTLRKTQSPFSTKIGEIQDAIQDVQKILPHISSYGALHMLINHSRFELEERLRESLANICDKHSINVTRIQAVDIQERYRTISTITEKCIDKQTVHHKGVTTNLDSFFLHRTWGYLIMLTVLFLMFQAVFFMADYPMTFIDWVFGELTGFLSATLPLNWFTDLLINGVLAGLGGILVFVPQIMILFAMITFLEDTGYMARISFLTDRFMRKIGLNGKSVMPMISGFACAVPAIMSARNIENRKERLLTIMATPLMSCSARLPVFTILISLVIPRETIFGFLNLQGLVMLGLYMLGLVIALLISVLFNLFIKIRDQSYFILELPVYRPPRWGNILLTMVQKAQIFVVDAGKVIMIISLILWALSSFGPGDDMEVVKRSYETRLAAQDVDSLDISAEMQAKLLEVSYAGKLGKFIEPVIVPLGYDWKIGIALITSFAAREVFVGTMATLYSVGDYSEDDHTTLRSKMAAAVRSDGQPVYTLATGVSLMIFYVLAMQCMSTLAIVAKETGSWKWPTLQFLYMTGLAYLLSMLAYNLLR